MRSRKKENSGGGKPEPVRKLLKMAHQTLFYESLAGAAGGGGAQVHAKLIDSPGTLPDGLLDLRLRDCITDANVHG